MARSYRVATLAFGVMAALACVQAASVRADAGDQARADQLFRAGKSSLAADEYAQACALFAESFELDPASGTLLALAICHERIGKLASAYREYGEALARSRADARGDRESAARARITALAAKLSRLTVVHSEPVGAAALELRIDGVAVDRDRIGTPIPLDGGSHSIDLSAAAKQPWHGTITLADSEDRQTLEVPVLQPAYPHVMAPVAEPSVAPRPRAPESRGRVEAAEDSMSAVQVLGLAATALGFGGFGVGTYFVATAMRQNHVARQACNDAACTEAGRRNRLDADAATHAAAIAFASGGALIATGVVMYVLGRPSPAAHVHAKRAPVVAAWAGPRALNVRVSGSF